MLQVPLVRQGKSEKKFLNQYCTKVRIKSVDQVRSQMKQIWEKFKQILLPNALLLPYSVSFSNRSYDFTLNKLVQLFLEFQKVVSKYFWYRWFWEQLGFVNMLWGFLNCTIITTASFVIINNKICSVLPK